jgi:hypothetical protein
VCTFFHALYAEENLDMDMRRLPNIFALQNQDSIRMFFVHPIPVSTFFLSDSSLDEQRAFEGVDAGQAWHFIAQWFVKPSLLMMI